jgi:uncharacterized membrane protein YbaN (DUF454 family)
MRTVEARDRAQCVEPRASGGERSDDGVLEPRSDAPDAPDGQAAEPTGVRSVRGALLLVAGYLTSGLALAGVFLPLVPTTPFLLLAAACFARSSPRMHRWLLSNPVFGPTLAQWRREHAIPRSAKRKAYLVVVATFALSIWAVEPLGLRAMLSAFGCALLFFLYRLPEAPAPGAGE